MVGRDIDGVGTRTADAGEVVVVVGNPRTGSRTRQLGEALGERLVARRVGSSLATLELAELADRLFVMDDEACAAAQARVRAAAALVVVSPVYKATYTGLLKAFFDRFAAGSLAGVPTVPALLGGSERHALALEVHLRPLLVEVGAGTLPGCYATEAQLDDMKQRIDHWWESAAAFLARATRPEVKVNDDGA